MPLVPGFWVIYNSGLGRANTPPILTKAGFALVYLSSNLLKWFHQEPKVF